MPKRVVAAKPSPAKPSWQVPGLLAAAMIGVGGIMAGTHTANPGPDYAAMLAATVILEDDGGHGSGVVVAPGLILTARHVAEDAQKRDMQARWENGEIEPVEIVWLAEDADIALMRFPARAKSYATAKVSCVTPRAGDPVTVVGNPLVLEFALSSGRVASNTSLQVPFDAPETIRSYAATIWGLDVPVVPGNSGGPVFNASGEVVGIVVVQLRQPNPGGSERDRGDSTVPAPLGGMVPASLICGMRF